MFIKSITRGVLRIGRPAFISLSLAFLLSCGGFSNNKESGTARIIENVPFHPQEIYQCGPASLAEVLNFWGIKVSPEEIAGEIYSPQAGGTLDADMVFFAERRGLDVRQYSGSWKDLQMNIDSRVPLLVLIDEGFWMVQKNHFMVVVGYDEKRILAHTGKTPYKSIPLDHFLNTWKRTKFWTLRITSKP